jgi:hypothetical protein
VILLQAFATLLANRPTLILVLEILVGGTAGVLVLLVLDRQLRSGLAGIVRRRTGFLSPSKEPA